MVELKNEDVFQAAKKKKGELYEFLQPLDLFGNGGSNSAKSVRQLYVYLKKNGVVWANVRTCMKTSNGVLFLAGCYSMFFC